MRINLIAVLLLSGCWHEQNISIQNLSEADLNATAYVGTSDNTDDRLSYPMICPSKQTCFTSIEVKKNMKVSVEVEAADGVPRMMGNYVIPTAIPTNGLPEFRKTIPLNSSIDVPEPIDLIKNVVKSVSVSPGFQWVSLEIAQSNYLGKVLLVPVTDSGVYQFSEYQYSLPLLSAQTPVMGSTNNYKSSYHVNQKTAAASAAVFPVASVNFNMGAHESNRVEIALSHRTVEYPLEKIDPLKELVINQAGELDLLLAKADLHPKSEIVFVFQATLVETGSYSVTGSKVLQSSADIGSAFVQAGGFYTFDEGEKETGDISNKVVGLRAQNFGSATQMRALLATLKETKKPQNAPPAFALPRTGADSNEWASIAEYLQHSDSVDPVTRENLRSVEGSASWANFISTNPKVLDSVRFYPTVDGSSPAIYTPLGASSPQ